MPLTETTLRNEGQAAVGPAYTEGLLDGVSTYGVEATYGTIGYLGLVLGVVSDEGYLESVARNEEQVATGPAYTEGLLDGVSTYGVEATYTLLGMESLIRVIHQGAESPPPDPDPPGVDFRRGTWNPWRGR